MAFIYAISDIHGYLQPLEEALSLVDLESHHENKLILCGDYIDYGLDSYRVLYKIKHLTEKYPNQVITLMGNHEYMFIDFLNAKANDIRNVEWLGSDKDFATVNSFISISTREKISQVNPDEGYHNYLFRISKIIKENILTNHVELTKWVKVLPFYFETENQIYVHAGIDEETEEYWKYGNSEEYYVSKYPATFGRFCKDSIAGHISTSSLARGSFRGECAFIIIFFDCILNSSLKRKDNRT